MASMNLVNEISKVDIQKADNMLGKGLNMPFAASNSGSRKLMFGSQQEQRISLLHPEVPYIQTGYEMEFGKNSSSYVQVDNDLEVIGSVAKFQDFPQHHFFLFAVDHESMEIHVFERKEYKHITENYGYLFDNHYIDGLCPGQMVKKGTTIQKSNAFDEYDNRMDGCNLLTLYSSCEETMEDAIIISETASKKLAAPLVKRIKVVINDNDIPLNLYGDMNVYKTFPDIGEETVNSILCALRREKKEEALYSQSYARLREPSISDERFTVAGRVVDIDVYCNAPEKLGDYVHNTQLKYYHDDKYRMAAEIVNTINPYLENGYRMNYDCQVLYSNARGILEGKHYFDEKEFSNIIVCFTVIEEIPVLRGDKLSNRYGGKGITARVKPDEMMPKTTDGKTVDIILNMCGVDQNFTLLTWRHVSITG